MITLGDGEALKKALKDIYGENGKNSEQLKKNLKVRQSDICKYNCLMDMFKEDKENINNDNMKHVKRLFRSFYSVRMKSTFFDDFIKYMYKLKNKPDTEFKCIYEETCFDNKRYVSYATKLLATINPYKPVIDSIVLKNLGIDKEYNRCKKIDATNNNSTEISKFYDELCNEYETFLLTHEAETYINLFNDALPMFKHFTCIKKLDLILWTNRE